MANNLSKLRKEFKLTQLDLANILNTSSTNIGYYELEKRDFSTKLLLQLADLFSVTIDYILASSSKGIKVYYDGNIVLDFLIDEAMLEYLISKSAVYYKNDSYKRYVNLNQLLGLKGYDFTNLLKSIGSIDELIDLLPTLPLNSRDDLDRVYCLTKIKAIDEQKIHAIKKILELL